MITRVKVTYVAMDVDGYKPIMSANTFEDLKKGLDDYFAAGRTTAECLGWYPYDTKYPDSYEGYYEYFWQQIIHNEIIDVVDKIKVYCVNYHPHTIEVKSK